MCGARPSAAAPRGSGCAVGASAWLSGRVAAASKTRVNRAATHAEAVVRRLKATTAFARRLSTRTVVRRARSQRSSSERRPPASTEEQDTRGRIDGARPSGSGWFQVTEISARRLLTWRAPSVSARGRRAGRIVASLGTRSKEKHRRSRRPTPSTGRQGVVGDEAMGSGGARVVRPPAISGQGSFYLGRTAERVIARAFLAASPPQRGASGGGWATAGP